MGRMSILFMGITFSLLLFLEQVNACSCTANFSTKKYLTIKQPLFGKRRSWTCLYTCTDSHEQITTVLGSHQIWYVVDDGLKGICDGAVYKNEWNPSTNDWVYMFQGVKSFNPKNSTSPELRAWNQRCAVDTAHL